MNIILKDLIDNIKSTFSDCYHKFEYVCIVDKTEPDEPEPIFIDTFMHLLEFIEENPEWFALDVKYLSGIIDMDDTSIEIAIYDDSLTREWYS